MLSRLAKVLLVFTAFAPTLVTYAFVQWRQGAFLPWGAACLGTSVGLAVLCALILRAAARMLAVIECHVDSIRTADTEIVGYVLSYLLPLANLGVDGVDPVLVAFVLAFFLVIVWTSHSYHFNPLLSLMGYHFYEVTDKTNVAYVMVTRRSLRTARHTARVVQLSEYILLDVDRAHA